MKAEGGRASQRAGRGYGLWGFFDRRDAMGAERDFLTTKFCREGTQSAQREHFLPLRSWRSFAAITLGCGASRAKFIAAGGLGGHGLWVFFNRRDAMGAERDF